MRCLGSLLLVLCALAACPASRESALAGADDGSGSGGGLGNAPQYCNLDRDCALAAATCCDCPAFAVNVYDPAHRACTGVTCPNQGSCPDNVHAACSTDGICVLACTEMICTNSCPSGFAIDETTGCLSCACAVPAVDGCTVDTDCVETRADCCGCHAGGEDTAVLASARAGFDAGLGCPPFPACPAVDVCVAGAAPHCIQGGCQLVATGGLQSNACGRDDLPACPTGQVCTVNQDPRASLLGVGLCVPQL